VTHSEVRVSRRGEARVRCGHPWIFRSDVESEGDAAAGSVVRVANGRGRTLGYAFFSSESEIRLRMVSRSETLDDDWLAQRLDQAVRWRDTVAPGARACRLVHGEGDGIPSLVVDRYGDYLVVQTLSQATDALRHDIARILGDRLWPKGILERNDPRVRQLEGLESRVEVLLGDVPPLVEVDENGITFGVDLWKGQKTGLFLDQQENHLVARNYARGRVLDAFTCDGGFALSVARGVESVLAVDISADALARTNANAQRNTLDNVLTLEANVFDLLRKMSDAGEQFDTVILDPPAFAKSKSAVEKAWNGYREINLRALRLLGPGGILITCSCSYHIHEADFETILAEAAEDAGASVNVVEKRRQGRDHPVLLGVPETHYLKLFILRRLA
jgi:23S rRNA (cytosine1962-C5)-methyltransferase